MHIDFEGLGDSTAAALVDAALAATHHSGNSGADSKRKRRELGPAVELPGVPPAASLGAAPTAPPNAPPRKKKNASGEHVLEALQASMGDLTERCAVRSHCGGGSGGDDGDEPTFVLERQEREEAWA